MIAFIAIATRPVSAKAAYTQFFASFSSFSLVPCGRASTSACFRCERGRCEARLHAKRFIVALTATSGHATAPSLPEEGRHGARGTQGPSLRRNTEVSRPAGPVRERGIVLGRNAFLSARSPHTKRRTRVHLRFIGGLVIFPSFLLSHVSQCSCWAFFPLSSFYLFCVFFFCTRMSLIFAELIFASVRKNSRTYCWESCCLPDDIL